MSLIGRLFLIVLAGLVSSLIAGVIIISAVLFPELSSIEIGGVIDPQAIDVLIGFGFIFLSGFALLPALIIVVLTEAFSIRSVLAYAVGGAIVGAACYLGLVPFDTTTMQFIGIEHRHLEVMTGAGIVAGLVYWLMAGRRAGAWRSVPAPSREAAPSQPPPPSPPSPPPQ